MLKCVPQHQMSQVVAASGPVPSLRCFVCGQAGAEVRILLLGVLWDFHLDIETFLFGSDFQGLRRNLACGVLLERVFYLAALNRRICDAATFTPDFEKLSQCVQTFWKLASGWGALRSWRTAAPQGWSSRTSSMRCSS